MSPHRRFKKGKSTGDYQVVYGKPPIETRFKPGESGNKKGRPPKRTKTLQEYCLDVLGRKMKLVENGNLRNGTIGEGITLKQAALALGGDTRAANFLHNNYKIDTPYFNNHESSLEGTHERALKELDRLMAEAPPADEEKALAGNEAKNRHRSLRLRYRYLAWSDGFRPSCDVSPPPIAWTPNTGPYRYSRSEQSIESGIGNQEKFYSKFDGFLQGQYQERK